MQINSTNSTLTNELFQNEEAGFYHTSYAQEKAVLECVQKGDVLALEATYRSLPQTIYGNMTSYRSQLKQLFYAGIANTTLVTRYAIKGGLDEETAFSLSDIYIRKMELCNDVAEMIQLSEEMALDFTTRVANTQQHMHAVYSSAITNTMESIYRSRREELSLSVLAAKVHLTPKYLSFLFHKEVGETITSFIHSVVIEEAKNLLTYSDYTLGEISNYLNFSSQSYFTNVFKKITGTTPGNYRRIHKQHTW